MSEQQNPTSDEPRIMVVGPDGQPARPLDGSGTGGDSDTGGEAGSADGRNLTDLVEEPAKVMRIGSMIRQLLDEVKSAPVDAPGRQRLAGILAVSIAELKDGLAPELDQELDRLIEPFSESTPTESELRIAQAQLVGWLEGLFHGIQTAIYSQQMAARAQLEQMRRALPPGSMPGLHFEGDEQGQSEQQGQQGQQGQTEGNRSGMYL
ncbi:MAG: bacterial proteasome activator family protein [Actinomycetota bacterium]|nr:bacterial proteasome activator family protein [Actinomycetota bacterium]